MGKGDKKSKRGKIAIGSYGVRRKRKKTTSKPKAVAKPKPAAKKPVAKKTKEKK
ncbi:30S ribosomal protein THX [Pontimicrobium sp. SW4]|uniref:30S ribosomal protein THX n=1 Tax=Pontimicrobium sp. SW4 TaxID=3153519 RepID=A0AAU7BP80_9FLAO